MSTRASAKTLRASPKQIQQQVRRAYRHFKTDPSHPGLEFKKLPPHHDVWSVRVTKDYRAVGQRDGERWSGSSSERMRSTMRCCGGYDPVFIDFHYRSRRHRARTQRLRGKSPRRAGIMNDELRPEYEFDYRQAKPNRFAAGLKPGGRIVVLEPEVAEVFQGSHDVNALLRAVMQALPLNGGAGGATP